MTVIGLKRFSAAACLLLLSSLQPYSILHAQPVITVVGNHAPPYRIMERKPYSGIYIDAMHEIALRIGVELEFIQAPCARSRRMMKLGNTADVILEANRTPAREQYMVYTAATFPQENKAFYIAPDAQDIRNYDDLTYKRIGVQIGQVYFPRFDYDANLIKDEVHQYALAMTKVSLKRNDTIIIPEQEGDWLLKQLNFKLKKASYIVPGNASYIAISRQSSALQYRPAIEKAMQKMKDEGVMDAIMERYR